MNQIKARIISLISASALLVTSAVVYREKEVIPVIDIMEAKAQMTEAGISAPVAGMSLVMSDSVASNNTIALIDALDGLSTREAVVEALDAFRVGSFEDMEVYITDALAPKEDIVEAAGEDYSNLCVAQVDTWVNVRSLPSEDGEVLGKLYDKSVGTVLGEENGWLKISSGSVEGYVSAEFVVIGDAELIKSVSRRVATVTCDGLYIRKEPSTDSAVKGLIPMGDDATVTDESLGDWLAVTTSEGDGYIYAEFTELSTEFVTAESKEEEAARLAKEEAARKAAAAAAAKKQNTASGVVAPGSGTGVNVANYALQFVGNPYVYGGSSLTNGTDCSGFVMSVYGAFGVGLPHSSRSLRGVGYGVDVGSMSAGDIVCYSGHVGICIGGGQIVHASNPTNGIIVSSAYYDTILAVRRIY